MSFRHLNSLPSIRVLFPCISAAFRENKCIHSTSPTRWLDWPRNTRLNVPADSFYSSLSALRNAHEWLNDTLAMLMMSGAVGSKRKKKLIFRCLSLVFRLSRVKWALKKAFSLPSVLSCIFSSFLLLVFFADRGMLLAGLV